MENWDIMFLTEAWMEQKNWERVRERLPKEWNWEVQFAERSSRKRE